MSLNLRVASEDPYELKEQLRLLKTQLKKYQIDKQTTDNEIKIYEDKLQGLKMQSNILGALDEVRYGDTVDTQNIDITSTNNITTKKFIYENLKLELPILNNDIKRILPKLEKEAILAEEDYYMKKESLLNIQNKLKQLPMQNNDNKEVDILHEKITKIQGNNKLIYLYLITNNNLIHISHVIYILQLYTNSYIY
jgi:hypothetical protein